MKTLSASFFDTHSEFLATKNIFGNETHEVKWLRCNGKIFKEGLFILNGSVVAEIAKILVVKNDFYFFCGQYESVGFDSYLNSYEIQKSFPIQNMLFSFTELAHKISYERKKCEEKLYIIADTLDVKNILS